MGDSAFPLHTWLMKPYGNAVLTPEQRPLNYCLSRACMVTEGAYGKQKGHCFHIFFIIHAKVETVKATTLACVVLHNVCIAKGDVNLHHWNMKYEVETNQRRSTEVVRELLQMRNCWRIRDTNSNFDQRCFKKQILQKEAEPSKLTL